MRSARTCFLPAAFLGVLLLTACGAGGSTVAESGVRVTTPNGACAREVRAGSFFALTSPSTGRTVLQGIMAGNPAMLGLMTNAYAYQASGVRGDQQKIDAGDLRYERDACREAGDPLLRSREVDALSSAAGPQTQAFLSTIGVFADG